MPPLTIISSTPTNYNNPSHRVKNAGTIEIEDNPLKDLLKNNHDGRGR